MIAAQEHKLHRLQGLEVGIGEEKNETNQIDSPKCVVDTYHMINVNFYFPILTENPKTTLLLQANLRLAKPLPRGLRSELRAQWEKNLN